MLDFLPEGLITHAELGIAAELEGLEGEEGDENLRDLADLIIRCTGVLIRHAAQQSAWTSENIPYEARVVAINFARRVLNNPQNQQRIQTGPLGESYHADELTGMDLKDSEEELLATFIDGEEGDLGGLGIVSIVRPDPLQSKQANFRMVPVLGLGGGSVPRMPLSTLDKYLGVD